MGCCGVSRPAQAYPPTSDPCLLPACCSPLTARSLVRLPTCPPALQYDDPVLLAADVEKKEATVRRVCGPVLSKKPPPPPPAPKPEEAAAPAAAAEAEMADAEEGGEDVGPPPPLADEAAQEESTPMEA